MDALRRWHDNVWVNRRWVWTGEYGPYYCSLWCFITDQRLCRGAS